MERDRMDREMATHYDELFPLSEQLVVFIGKEIDLTEEHYFLHVGCATGRLSYALAQLGAFGVGIDTNEDLLERAKRNFSSIQLNFRNMDPVSIGKFFPPKYFQSVICVGDTLPRLSAIWKVKSFFTQASSLICPGGKLVIEMTDFDFIIKNQVDVLPVVETDDIRLEQRFEFPTRSDFRIKAVTGLTLKSTGEKIADEYFLLPLRKGETEKIAQSAGFAEFSFLGGFDGDIRAGTTDRLIMVAKKQ